MKKQLLLLLAIFGIGFLVGVVSGFKVTVSDYNSVDKNAIQTFINTFTMNYWYLFIMCILNDGASVIVNLFIIFCKGITLGTSFGILLKNKALFGLGVYLTNFLGQFIILVPLMFVIVLLHCESFDRKLTFVTVVLASYSFIIALI